MIKLLKKGMQVLNGEFAHYERLRVNAENEYLVMSCGAFNPRFLAKIKKVRRLTTRLLTKMNNHKLFIRHLA